MNKNFQLFVPSAGVFLGGIEVLLRRAGKGYLLLYHQFFLFFTHSPSRPGVSLSILVSWSSKMLQATQNAALEWNYFVRCCLECSQAQKLLQLGVIWGFLGIFLLFPTFMWSWAQAQLMGTFHALLVPRWFSLALKKFWGLFYPLCLVSFLFNYLMHLLTLFWFLSWNFTIFSLLLFHIAVFIMHF